MKYAFIAFPIESRIIETIEIFLLKTQVNIES